MKQKKVEYEDLDSGQKFMYNRRLYIKSDTSPVQLSNGFEPRYDDLPDDALVTPVKVQITVK